MKRVEILETTLRDGSYMVNFSFTPADTSAISRELEACGFRFIEIGHGAGLNASNRGLGQAVATDEEYLAAAREALTKAKFGMFCIPGVARLEDVDMAARHGMHFIRIGTNVTDVERSESFIRRAKDHGMFVAANYMKSYAMAPREFSDLVRMSERFGADLVYVVDSAGGMFPSDVEAYYHAARGVTSLPIGFHAHDNLGLAVANSLRMVEVGAAFVDSSLQGLGRSAGNAGTEMLVAALAKQGIETGIDLLRTLRAGHQYIQPIIPTRGRMPLDVIAGYAEFHSSYMPKILKAAGRHCVDPAVLIIEACKIDKVNVDDAILEKIAAALPKTKPEILRDYGFSQYVGGEQDAKR